MKQLTTYENQALFNDCEIRILGTSAEPWFVVIDIFKILGIPQNIMSRTLKQLDDDEKSVIKLMTEGGKQDVNIVSEPGLYKILFRSRTPIAKQFTRWVTHEVLPNIRRHGYYKLSIQEQKVKIYKNIVTLKGVNHLDNRFSKMSLSELKLYERQLKQNIELDEEKQLAKEIYPYSYDEMDKLCDYDLEYIIEQSKARENKGYMTTLSNGEQLFSESFKNDINKFIKMYYDT